MDNKYLNLLLYLINPESRKFCFNHDLKALEALN
jgi:hypothetical protein